MTSNFTEAHASRKQYEWEPPPCPPGSEKELTPRSTLAPLLRGETALSLPR